MAMKTFETEIGAITLHDYKAVLNDRYDISYNSALYFVGLSLDIVESCEDGPVDLSLVRALVEIEPGVV